MATPTRTDPLEDILELAAVERPAWDGRLAAIPTWHPRNEGDADADADADADKGAGSGDADADADADKGAGSGDPDWKSESRKHERRAKQERKDREAAEQRLKELEDADKSEQEKAIEKAKQDGRAEALTESQKERRADRLEVAVTRLAARGIQVGAGDDAKTLKFADPEDALVFIERAITRGDLDEDDIFDQDGKVQTDAVTEALKDLLERKPRLADAGNGGSGAGDADAGKGAGNGKDLEDLSVEDHLKAVQNR